MRGLVAPAAPRPARRASRPPVTLTEREPWDTIDLVASGHSDVGVVHSWGDLPVRVPDHVTGGGRPRRRGRPRPPRPPARRPPALATRPRRRGLDRHRRRARSAAQWLTGCTSAPGVPRIAHVSMEFDSHIALVARRARHRAGAAARPAATARGAWSPCRRTTRCRRARVSVLHRRSSASPAALREAVAALRAATQKSAEARFCRPRSTRGSSLPTAANSPIRCSRAGPGRRRPCADQRRPAG
jgi:hypothetical protein